METTRYVLGFLFDTTLSKVVLIRKERPDWMKGKWNAIGGKVKEGESLIDAMVRECDQEAGIRDTSRWERFASMTGEGFDVFCYRATTNDIMAAHGREVDSELVIVSNVKNIVDHALLPDLQWLVHAAITHFHHPNNLIELKRYGHPHLTSDDKDHTQEAQTS